MVLDSLYVHFLRSLSNFDGSINAIIYGVDLSPSVHIDNRKKIS